MAIMAAMNAAMLANPIPGARQIAALNAIPAYESRGKGEGRSNRRAPGAGMAARRAARKARNVRRHRAASRG
ncbi:hypothetical protein D3C87_475650 [compost metagenome]